MKPRAATSRRRSSGHARCATRALRRGRRRRLPAGGRILALLLLAGLLGGGVTLVNGPWLRVEQVAFAGGRFTPAASLEEILDAYRGDPLLAVDSRAVAQRVRSLPAVASVRVATLLPDQLQVTIAEKEPAFTWVTSAARLVGAGDGTLIAELPRDAELAAELAALPAIDDQRRRSRLLIVGDAVPGDELHMALRLLELDPSLLGSAATRLTLRIDAEYGFVLVSPQPGWQAAFGLYGLDPAGDAVGTDARLEQQVAAVRTLFATRPEASVRWVDARNPGRVYWAP